MGLQSETKASLQIPIQVAGDANRLTLGTCLSLAMDVTKQSELDQFLGPFVLDFSKEISGEKYSEHLSELNDLIVAVYFINSYKGLVEKFQLISIGPLMKHVYRTPTVIVPKNKASCHVLKFRNIAPENQDIKMSVSVLKVNDFDSKGPHFLSTKHLTIIHE